MREVHDIIADLGAAKDAHNAVANTAPAPVLRPLHEAVKDLQAELNDTIVDGAEPCPSCGGDPIGMVQNTDKGTCFEVGCPVCGYFLHTDGTARDHGAQGGMPRHAVEMWHAGPNFWRLPIKGRFNAAELAALPALKPLKSPR